MAPTSFGDVLARNIRAARSRRDLSQQAVAARMRALGFDAWVHQTVGNVEKGKRRVTADEILGLAWALETTINALLTPIDEDEAVKFPSGNPIDVLSVRWSVEGGNDGAVLWNGDVPAFSRSAEQAPSILDSDHGARSAARWAAATAARIQRERLLKEGDQ